MENVLLTVHLILALLLVGVVLLQRSEGGGLGMGGGGGGAMSQRQAANAMTRATWIIAVAFICTSLALTIVAASNSSTGSVLDQIGSQGEADSGAPVGNDLLPPTTGSNPLAPPRAEDLTPGAAPETQGQTPVPPAPAN
ncbi:preprotein translocase subunit SecG [Falsirhodobacter halotolerans]|uniref:preprotein translocase subunit SecG n=1 Tax=Falsirhodobacter halotolerans TaxID=1146892 RepID=UPI001FD4FAC0|nr:preprotein translocase subunit SecG [Falsirhodobacter halotolerans]MCJ8140282.1 preprotein translocase subunit SecG [Falsirhodobacter halotolerans]